MSLRLEKLLIHLLCCAIIKVNLVRPETLETWERDRRYDDRYDKLEFWERDPKYEAGRHVTKFCNHVRSARKRMWQYRRHAMPIATDTIYSKQEKLRKPVEISGNGDPIDNYTFNIQLLPTENNFKTYIDEGGDKRKKRKGKKKRRTDPKLKQERTSTIENKRTAFTIDRFYHRVQEEQNTTTDTPINKKLKGRRKNKKQNPARRQRHHHHRHKKQNRFRAPLLDSYDSYLDNNTIKELEKIARSSDIDAVDLSQETTTQQDKDSFLKIILVPETPERESSEGKITGNSEERPFKNNDILQSDNISIKYNIEENTETTTDDSVTPSEMSATNQSETSTVFMATQGFPVDEDETPTDMSAINVSEASITYTTRDSSEVNTVPASDTTTKDVLRESFTETTTDSSDENIVLQSDTTTGGKSVTRTTHKIKNNAIGDGTDDIVPSSNLSNEAINESPATEKEHLKKKTRTHSKTKKMIETTTEVTTLPPIGRERHAKRKGKKKKKHKTQDTTVIRNRKETSAEEFSGTIRPHNLKKHMHYLMKQFPDVKTKIEVIGTTVGYNDIVMLKLSPIKSKCGHFRADDKYVKEGPVKQYVFIVHGLNTMGIEEMPTFTETKQFKELLSYYIKQLDKFDILLVPMANPDGYAYSLQTGNMWNKNMSPQDDCPGVALDRNFEVAWKERRNVSSCSQSYPGPTPLSEKETLAISSVFHKYSNKIYAYINVHPGTYSANTFKGEAVLFPKGYTEAQSDDDKYVDLKGEIDEAMRNASFNVMSVTVDNLAIWYGVVTGSSVDFASTIYGIPYAMEFVMQSYTESRGLDALKEIWRRIITATFTAMYNKYTNKEN